ncbi:hypothetical protein OQA88_11859 [Cercophora sp. LCS_1]
MRRRAIRPSLRRLCVFAFPTLAAAFGTVNEPTLLGQHNEHEMVTRLAFQCPKGQKSDGNCFEPGSLDQLAGYHVDFWGIPIIGGGFNGAVGSPDTMDPVPEGPEAHCDDADFIDMPGYPRSRAEATEALQTCVNHLRARFRQAWRSAEDLLDDKGAIRNDMVDLSRAFGGDCIFAFPSLQVNLRGRAKCHVIEGLGRALHGVQDFYAHSNWVDEPNPDEPISDTNPPGLARSDTAKFIVDLHATGPIPADQIPHNLSTGCFAIPDKTPGEGSCAGRVTHHTLTKDHGIIHLNGTFGAAGPDTPRAEPVQTNFERAVQAAVQASRDAWANFRKELERQYGKPKADLMICCLVRDDPVKECRRRMVALVLDRSRMSHVKQTSELLLQAAQSLNSKLETDGTDKVAAIIFDETAHVTSEWSSPPATLGPLEETDRRPNIGEAIHAAIDTIVDEYPDIYTDRGAIFLLTSGSEGANWTGETLLQVQRARTEGIRVHYACISLPPLTKTDVEQDMQWSECSPGTGVIPAVLKTGGLFAFVSQRRKASAGDIGSLVLNHGLTKADDLVQEGTAVLYPEIALAAMLTSKQTSKSFVYSAKAGETVNLTIQDRVLEGQGTGGCVGFSLKDKTLGAQVAANWTCEGVEPMYLVHKVTAAAELELIAEYKANSNVGVEADEEEVVFTVELNTNIPEKNDGTTASRFGQSSTASMCAGAVSTCPSSRRKLEESREMGDL